LRACREHAGLDGVPGQELDGVFFLAYADGSDQFDHG
jgi:hypothetical protein